MAELGRGGYGVVVLARHRASDRLVAIKRIRGVLETDPEVAGQLRREGQSLAALAHPAVVQLYDVVVDGPDLSLVMEYVPGASLGQLVHAGPLPVRRLLVILADVAAALRCAAEQGITHGDVKPANVLVLPTGRAKLGDFGIARVLRTAAAYCGQAGAAPGSPAYAAPEQIRGDADPDSRGDAYSFTVMAYELFTGQPPFQAENATAMIADHLGAEPRRPGELVNGFPAVAEAALLAGLAKEPATRPTPADLVQALAAVPTEEWPAELRDRPWSPPAGRRTATRGARVRGGAEALEIGAPSTGRRQGIAERAAWVEPPVIRPPARSRRRSPWAAVAVGAVLGLVTIAVVVVVREAVTVVREAGGPLTVSGVTVTVTPETGRCPRETFTFTGEIQTNGRPGVLRLRWTEPDGDATPVSTVRVESGRRQVDARLRFDVQGARPFSGAARLHVLAPGSLDSDAVEVRYVCV